MRSITSGPVHIAKSWFSTRGGATVLRNAVNIPCGWRLLCCLCNNYSIYILMESPLIPPRNPFHPTIPDFELYRQVPY